MNENAVEKVSPEELSAFVRALSNRHFTGLVAEYPDCPPNHEEVGVMVGQKYARLITVCGGQTRSAMGFIDLTNGNILKAAGWSAPAKGARGNIRRGDVSNLWNGAFTSPVGGLHVAYLR